MAEPARMFEAQTSMTRALCLCLALGLATPAAAATLITNARLVDGTGAPARSASVRIEGDRIAAIGDLKAARGDTIIDAHGLVLAPGFIDSHSHHDGDKFAERTMPALLAQGVTTIVVGNDGFSELGTPGLAAVFAKAPPSINAAAYTAHGDIRGKVMGTDYKRPATPAELAAMQKLLADDMAAGSLGLSTGLEYDPGIYSQKAEVIALAKTAAAHGGRYISHMRSEDVAFDAALDELLDIGRQAKLPVQISHLKLAIVDRWGGSPAVIAKLDKARAEGIDVTADVYPYEYWQSSLTVLFPKRDFTDLKQAQFALTSLSTPEGMLIARYAPDPALVGKTIAEIAKARGTPPAETYLNLIQAAEAWGAAHPGEDVESVIATSMRSDDVANFIAWEHANVCSDGSSHGLHPRGKGSFPKIIRLYVRDQQRLSLEQAVHKMTAVSAAHLGMTERGTIRPGAVADLILFDPATFTDHADTKTPDALATGMERVWVAGVPVWAEGKPTGATPGRFIKREAGKPGA
jgi:N-acyl-D-amino-acid deacylase